MSDFIGLTRCLLLLAVISQWAQRTVFLVTVLLLTNCNTILIYIYSTKTMKTIHAWFVIFHLKQIYQYLFNIKIVSNDNMEAANDKPFSRWMWKQTHVHLGWTCDLYLDTLSGWQHPIRGSLRWHLSWLSWSCLHCDQLSIYRGWWTWPIPGQSLKAKWIYLIISICLSISSNVCRYRSDYSGGCKWGPLMSNCAHASFCTEKMKHPSETLFEWRVTLITTCSKSIRLVIFYMLLIVNKSKQPSLYLNRRRYRIFGDSFQGWINPHLKWCEMTEWSYS